MRRRAVVFAATIAMPLIAGCFREPADPTRVPPRSQLTDLINNKAATSAHVMPDHVWREVGQPGDDKRGLASLDSLATLRRAFPDWNVRTSYASEEGNVVLIEGVARGTHRGPFGRSHATDQEVGANVAALAVVREGQVVETLAYLGTDIYRRQIAPTAKQVVPPVPAWPATEAFEKGRLVHLSHRVLADLYGFAAYGACARLLDLHGVGSAEHRAFGALDPSRVSAASAIARSAKLYFDPLRVTVRNSHVLGRSVASRVEIRGKTLREVGGLRAGQEFQAEALLVAHFEGERISSARFYFDDTALRP